MIEGVKEHLEQVRLLHRRDLDEWFGAVWLPDVLGRKSGKGVAVAVGLPGDQPGAGPPAPNCLAMVIAIRFSFIAFGVVIIYSKTTCKPSFVVFCSSFCGIPDGLFRRWTAKQKHRWNTSHSHYRQQSEVIDVGQ